MLLIWDINQDTEQISIGFALAFQAKKNPPILEPKSIQLFIALIILYRPDTNSTDSCDQYSNIILFIFFIKVHLFSNMKQIFFLFLLLENR